MYFEDLSMRTSVSTYGRRSNLVPRAHVPFGQHQDTELSGIINFQSPDPEPKILGLPVSRRMRGLVYMASRDQVEVDTFHKGIQYPLEKLGKSKFGFERTVVSYFLKLINYSRSSYPTRASYSGQVDEMRNPMKPS